MSLMTYDILKHLLFSKLGEGDLNFNSVSGRGGSDGLDRLCLRVRVLKNQYSSMSTVLEYSPHRLFFES